MRITEVNLAKRQRVELEYMEYFDTRPFMQKRSSIILKKADGLSSKRVAEMLACSEPMVNRWIKRYLEKGVDGLRNKPGQGAKPINHGCIGRRSCEKCYRIGQTQCHEDQGEMATGRRQGGVSRHVPWFFISLGARFGLIGKTTKGTPSPQLYAYKKEKLQDLEQQYRDGLIDLYFGDGNFTCSEWYVPYGWQFPGENITIPSDRGAKLNIWGMIDYDSRYHGFCSTESMPSERIADFLDRFSLTIRKNTFLVLDNAKVHRSKYMKEMRKIWEKRGFYLFFLLPYSPHLNIAETLWRMLKGQGYSPQTMSRLTTFSMLSTEVWQGWEPRTLSIFPKGPDMFIYLYEVLMEL